MARLAGKGNKPGRLCMAANVAKDVTATDTRQAKTEERKAIASVQLRLGEPRRLPRHRSRELLALYRLLQLVPLTAVMLKVVPR